MKEMTEQHPLPLFNKYIYLFHPQTPKSPIALTTQLLLLFYHHSRPFIYKGGINMSWTGGDWMCAACQHQNFKKREVCQRCGYPKYGGPDVSTYLMYNRTEVLAGDWYCAALNCGAHNYASRTNCYRCGAMKNDYGGYGMMGSESSVPPGWKTGDWMCTRYGCGVHNYASRMECYKCKTPRDFGGA